MAAPSVASASAAAAADAASSSFAVKIISKASPNDMRRVSVSPPTYAQLDALVRTQLFAGVSGSIKYVDDEGDEITIGSDADLREARALQAESAQCSLGPLRLLFVPAHLPSSLVIDEHCALYTLWPWWYRRWWLPVQHVDVTCRTTTSTRRGDDDDPYSRTVEVSTSRRGRGGGGDDDDDGGRVLEEVTYDRAGNVVSSTHRASSDAAPPPQVGPWRVDVEPRTTVSYSRRGGDDGDGDGDGGDASSGHTVVVRNMFTPPASASTVDEIESDVREEAECHADRVLSIVVDTRGGDVRVRLTTAQAAAQLAFAVNKRYYAGRVLSATHETSA